MQDYLVILSNIHETLNEIGFTAQYNYPVKVDINKVQHCKPETIYEVELNEKPMVFCFDDYIFTLFSDTGMSRFYVLDYQTFAQQFQHILQFMNGNDMVTEKDMDDMLCRISSKI